ncbi:MAG TPA: ATP-binding protein [Kofleriaceae bacterium]|nr:ATP-binding protein [Kofleriaceae bacterium]
MADEVDELRAKLARADHQIALLEATIRDRSNETARINHTLRMSHEFFRGVYRTMPGSLFFVDDRGLVEDANDNLLHLLGARQEHVIGLPAAGLFAGEPPPFAEIVAGPVNRAAKRSERALRSRDGRGVPVLFSATALQIPGERRRSVVCVALDISDRKRIEAELRQSQKLESVGRLAAGVAHEINTPVQFVSDNVQFVRDTIADLRQVIAGHRAVRSAVLAGEPWQEALASVTALEEEVEVDELLDRAPAALELARDGLQRVATIVRSMTTFAHPQRQMAPCNLTEAIRATLTVAASEYKLVADLVLDLCELPPVMCHLGDINQAILNLVINAAHAIADTVRQTGERGRLVVCTRRAGDDVIISISDTGGGIPEAVREHMFDPFFTTKEVGRGTGQGLAIARTVVYEMHGGEITFETELGKGTTFHVRLPIVPDARLRERARIDPDAR